MIFGRCLAQRWRAISTARSDRKRPVSSTRTSGLCWSSSCGAGYGPYSTQSDLCCHLWFGNRWRTCPVQYQRCAGANEPDNNSGNNNRTGNDHDGNAVIKSANRRCNDTSSGDVNALSEFVNALLFVMATDDPVTGLSGLSFHTADVPNQRACRDLHGSALLSESPVYADIARYPSPNRGIGNDDNELPAWVMLCA